MQGSRLWVSQRKTVAGLARQWRQVRRGMMLPSWRPAPLRIAISFSGYCVKRRQPLHFTSSQHPSSSFSLAFIASGMLGQGWSAAITR